MLYYFVWAGDMIEEADAQLVLPSLLILTPLIPKERQLNTFGMTEDVRDIIVEVPSLSILTSQIPKERQTQYVWNHGRCKGYYRRGTPGRKLSFGWRPGPAGPQFQPLTNKAYNGHSGSRPVLNIVRITTPTFPCYTRSVSYPWPTTHHVYSIST